MGDFDLRHRQRLVDLVSRRDFLSRLGMGAGMMALASLLTERAGAEGVTAQRHPYNLLPKTPHKAPKAKRVIYFSFRPRPCLLAILYPLHFHQC